MGPAAEAESQSWFLLLGGDGAKNICTADWIISTGTQAKVELTTRGRFVVPETPKTRLPG